MSILRNSILLASSILLVACGAEDESSSSQFLSLPEVNQDLDINSAVGIWAVVSNEAVTSETRGVENITEEVYWEETENYNLEYTAQSRSYVRITRDDNHFIKIESCHIYDHTAVEFNQDKDVDDYSFNIENTEGQYYNGWSFHHTEGEIGNLDNVTTNNRSFYADIKFADNLSMVGSVVDTTESYNDTNPEKEYFHKIVRTVEMEGVKISDSANFSDAQELTFDFQLSSAGTVVEDSRVLSNDEMNCLSVSHYQLKGTKEGLAVDKQGLSVNSLFDETDELVELKVEEDNSTEQLISSVNLIVNANSSEISLTETCSGYLSNCSSIVDIENLITGSTASLTGGGSLLDTELKVELTID